MISLNAVVVIPAPEDESEPEEPWQEEVERWRDVETRRLEALLSGESVVSGTGGQAGGGGTGSTIAPLINDLLNAPDTGESMHRLFTELLANDRLVEAFAEVEGATRFSSVLELARQQKGAKALRAVISDPSSDVDDLKRVLTAESWVFGGRYIPPASLDNIRVLQQVDLVLIGIDRAIHIVVVGPANVPDLVVVRDDGNYEVGNVVQAKVVEAVTHLLNVDKDEAVRIRLGVETRRAFATVVIGHPTYATKLPGSHLRDTLRTYSSYLTGIQIMTYDQLVDTAERSLALLRQAEPGQP
jgi:hypothetical protein